MNYISFPTAQHAVDKIAQEFVIYSQLNHSRTYFPFWWFDA
ncbi:predicted coding region HI0557 [Haemophilus influenzae Rd KW20]|uniref:Uncharacterized protein HI_0557 n=1 Tax=Haemophilus influenzae (strain ATCC 51907 / DSM 11121 / KW20 / Rd) TaxID=71421 RepID=Y557_HAEIN|nr:RecName: Full=Uncharacterized protein HI_0557 [Haemophilus influenzae Rd KW20]AAC22218.1 predicted coding region HI0557 [Haemophilus influenzae Rd KW20]